MQNQHIDLLINIQQTPKHLLQKSEPYTVPPKPEDAANQLLKQIEAILKGTPNEIYTFYQTVMPVTYREHFLEKDWPTTSALQQLFDTEYKTTAVTLYNEYAMRTSWERTLGQKGGDAQGKVFYEAWEEYSSIFEHEWTKVNFPAEVVWDLYHNFVQMFMAEKSREGTKKYFTKNEMVRIFTEISKSMPSSFSQNPTTKQIFALYSLVALAVVEASESNFKQALKHISRISLKQTSILSKGIGSLLTTFFIAGFAYFMLGEYYRSVKVCETIVPFFLKYRKFFDKSASFHTYMQPLFEKLVVLQCTNYIFLEQKPKAATFQVFKNTHIKTKQKQVRDKVSECFFKLKQNDLPTMLRLFNFIAGDFALPQTCIGISQKFHSLQQVNINTIIQNYKRIQVDKMSKMLNLPSQQILRQINSLEATSSESNSAWDVSIMNPLLRQKKKVNVVIEGNVAVFDSQNVDAQDSAREWRRYREELAWLGDKLKAL